MMNELKLSNLLTPKNILLDVKEKEKDALLAKIIKTFSEVNNIADPEALAREVTEREALASVFRTPSPARSTRSPSFWPVPPAPSNTARLTAFRSIW